MIVILQTIPGGCPDRRTIASRNEVGMAIAPTNPFRVEGTNAPRVFGARYQVERELKADFDAATYLASDLTSGKTVVIKTARANAFSATARMRLDHEARVLAQLTSAQ